MDFDLVWFAGLVLIVASAWALERMQVYYVAYVVEKRSARFAKATLLATATFWLFGWGIGICISM